MNYRLTMKRILIAVCPGSVASYALDAGLKMARSLRAEVGLIYVAEPIAPLGSDIGIPTHEVGRLAREEGRKVLAAIRAKHSLPVSVQEFIEAGDPATKIRGKAEDWAADIIVTGSHGRRGLSRIMLGSVAEAVVRRAPCPVLVVRPKVDRRRNWFGRPNCSVAEGDRVCSV